MARARTRGRSVAALLLATVAVVVPRSGAVDAAPVARAAAAGTAAGTSAGVAAVASSSGVPGPVPLGDWLTLVNLYRATADVGPVVEDPAASAAALQHAHYLAANDRFSHDEDATLPFASDAGAQAGRTGNVSTGDGTAREAIEGWMTSPFHALGTLDPRARRFGLGVWRETEGATGRVAATMPLFFDHYPATAPARANAFVWPANGSAVPLVRYSAGETPDPLTACPGYSQLAGLPMVVRFASKRQIASAAFTDRTTGADLEVCTFDAMTYVNPDRAEQDLARSILGGTDAVVIPRNPLAAGHAYSLTVVDSKQQVTSTTFSVTTGAILPAPGSAMDGMVTPGDVSTYGRVPGAPAIPAAG